MLKPLEGKLARAVEASTCKQNIFEGAVRSGKTVASTIAWLEHVLHAPPGPLLMVGRTERTLVRNIIEPILTWLGNERAKLIQGQGELWICGRRIYLVGANDAQSQEKIRGLTLAGAYVDELTTIPESFYQMLLSRLSVPGAKLIATTNPDNPRHWLMRDFLVRAQTHITQAGNVATLPPGPNTLDLARFSITLQDNAANLPAGYVDELDKLYTGLWRKRFIQGQWVQAEGAVYPMFDPAVHETQDLLVTDRLALGIDPGTNHPFAAVKLCLAEDPAGGECLYISDEFFHDSTKTGMRLSPFEYSARLREWIGDEHYTWTVTDSASAYMIQQLYSDGVSNAAPADKSVLDGIQLVSSLLSRNKLKVNKRCTNLLEELVAYSWSDSASDRGKDEPIKLNDDACDALRYAVKTTHLLWRDRIQ